MTSATIIHTTRTGFEVTFNHVPLVFDENGTAWTFAPGNSFCHDSFGRAYNVVGEKYFTEVVIKGQTNAN